MLQSIGNYILGMEIGIEMKHVIPTSYDSIFTCFSHAKQPASSIYVYAIQMNAQASQLLRDAFACLRL